MGLDNGKRAAQNRQIRREALRDQLKGIAYLTQIDRVEKELVSESDFLKKNRSVLSADGVGASNARIRSLVAVADLNFRRLAKVLPDLKSIELSDADGENPFNSLATALRAAVTHADE